MSAFGRGSDVRCGFCANAASMAFSEDLGVTSVISYPKVSHIRILRKCLQTNKLSKFLEAITMQTGLEFHPDLCS